MSSLKLLLTSLLIIASGSALPAEANILRYAPTVEQAEWTSGSSKLRCKISQTIPRYGYVQFIRYAGKPLNLLVYSEEKPVRPGKAVLRAEPEAWKHGSKPRVLGSISYRTREPIFKLPRSLAQRALFELEQGMAPSLHFKHWGVNGNEVMVSMSSVNFLSALETFRACTAELIPYDFATASKMNVFFKGGSTELTESAMERLNAIADYLMNDPSIAEAYVEGHSDALGEIGKNFELSKQRAEAAYNYLLQRGVTESKLKLRYYGQRRPIASNKTAAGRAKNRRVSLRLIK